MQKVKWMGTNEKQDRFTLTRTCLEDVLQNNQKFSADGQSSALSY